MARIELLRPGAMGEVASILGLAISAVPLLFPYELPWLAAAAGVGLLLLGPGLLWRGGRALPASPVTAWLVVYLLLSLLSFVASPDAPAVLHRLTTLLTGAVLYGTALIWINEGDSAGRQRLLLAAGLALFGAASALAGLLALDWPARVIVDVSPFISRLPRLSSRTIHPNTLAGILILLLPFAALWWRAARVRRQRILWAGTFVLMAFVLFLTQSRNALLAALVASGIAAAWGRIRFRALFIILLLLLVLPVAVTRLPDAVADPLIERIAALDAASKWGPAHERSWLERLELWRAATNVMADYPVLGAGLYRFDAASRANEVFHIIQPGMAISHAHNLFLQAGASLGWAGWLSLAGLWGSTLFAVWQYKPARPGQDPGLRRALLASITGYLVFNSFDVLALEQRAGIPVWLVLALAASLPAPAAPHLRRLPAIVLVAWLLLALTPARPANLARLQLDEARLQANVSQENREPPSSLVRAGDSRRLGLWHLLQGETERALGHWRADPEAVPFLVGQGQEAILVDGNPAAALDWYTLALALDSRYAPAYYWRGLAYEALGKEADALADFQQAAVYGEEDEIWGVAVRAAAWERQGRILAAWGQWPAAVRAFGNAAALDPEDADYQKQLGDVTRALEEWRAAMRR